MSSVGLELAGVSVAVVGWLLSVVSCALPMWRVSAFIGANIVTAQVYWEGLWMSCVFQSTGQMQCKVYDSMLALPPDLQAARALTVVSIIIGVLALLISMVGAKCTNCIEDEGVKARVTITSGAAFIVAALAELVPVSWSANTIVVEFYSPIVLSGQKMEIGALCRRRNMSMGMELVGICLGALGFLMSIVTCALPMWKVTAFVGANIITAQTIWEGLWMNCVTQSTGQMQCKVYDSMLALPQDLQAARAMMIVAIILGILGALVSTTGAKCTNCIEDEGAKAKVMILAGIMFILAGLLVLIPACWTAHVVVRNFYSPILTNPQRRELGASLYVGWGASALLLIGGAILCSSCPPKERRYKPPRMAYSAPRSNNTGYDRKDYV
ncbi:claudin-3-like [Syngnathus typhle]|uniref:claudin-3-like n=1 Tax=Syngnathus typhle TaxID=161592 RepID=UPI002A6ABF8A|nr:claudin-3-like [Syngnathus typhle]XP_061155155.1 claudin-3-like [Syngnathus typhle]